MIGITEYLRINAANHSNRESLVSACINETGRSRKDVSGALYDIQIGKSPIVFNSSTPVNELLKLESPKINGKIHGISETELRKKHDIKFIIEQNAQRLVYGEYVSERDFIRQCNIVTGSGYRQYLEDEIFDKYKGKASGIVYWSCPESIIKMKSEGILR